MADRSPASPPAVRAYMAAVATATVALFLGGILFPFAPGGDDAGLRLTPSTVLLVGGVMVAIALALRFPLQLTYRTRVSVDTAPLFAAAILFPAPLAMVSAALGVAVHHVLKRADDEETIFNTAQTALYVGVGGATYQAATALGLPAEFGAVVAVAAAAAVMHVVNSLVVSTMGALQVGTDPMRAWSRGLHLDLPEHAVLSAIGALAVWIGREQPWLLPLLLVPIGLAHLSLRRGVAVRAATQAEVETLAALGELRDPAWTGHAVAVAGIAEGIARRLGVNEADTAAIAAAARVHGVGRMLSPHDRRRGRSAPGTSDRHHAAAGAAFIARFPAYALAATFVRSFQEHWDGGGHPGRLRGEAIPLGARILAVADAYDAAQRGSDGLAPLSPTAALRRLGGEAGTCWDPAVVAALAAVVDPEPDAIPVYAAFDATHRPGDRPHADPRLDATARP